MASTGSSFSAATPDAESARADLVVGLTSHNDAETIVAVTNAVRASLAGRFGGIASRIVLADAGSTDDTTARARAALEGVGGLIEVPTPRGTAELLEVPYHGVQGRARALRAILTAASHLEARACVALDAGAPTLAPQLVEGLAAPILQDGVDFTLPYYRRHLYEGALTKGIVYPVVRSLYGVRIRQPTGGEFACSSRLLTRLLDEDFWDHEGVRVGIDLWLTTAAVSDDVKVAETALGVRAHRVREGEALDLGTTIAQVVGALFADLESRVDTWQRVRGSKPVARFGELAPASPAHGSVVDPERLIESYRLGYRELRDIWTWVLPPKTIVELGRLINGPTARFQIDDELWARIIYDFALAFRMRVLARDHLLRSLVPLYLGWFASFILQAREMSPDAVDERVGQLGLAFEAEKPYLIARWRWPERLRT